MIIAIIIVIIIIIIIKDYKRMYFFMLNCFRGREKSMVKKKGWGREKEIWSYKTRRKKEKKRKENIKCLL